MSAHDWQEMTDNCCNPRCRANRNAPSSKEPCPCSWDWPPQHSRTSNPMIWSAQFECSECKAKHNVACSQPYFKVLEFQCLRCHATTMTDKGLARETKARRESWSLHVWENDGGYYRCQICETMSLEAHTAKLCPGRRSNATEPPYRVRAFWSPCRKYIASVCVSEGNITLIDDDGRIWEPTGPEQDMTKQSAQKSEGKQP